MKNKSILFFVLLLLASNVIRAQDAQVKMQFGAFDKDGNFFAGLKASDVQVKQNKNSVQLASFDLKTDIPLEILIMIDASISQERMLPDEKKAAEYFIDNVLKSGKDKVAIISFTGKISLEQDLTGDFARAKEQLRNIEFEPPEGYVGGGIITAGIPPVKNSAQMAVGSTSIWDSIVQVAEASAKVKSSSVRRAIILISDGINTYGEAKLKEAVASSIKNGIPVYAIGIGDEFYGGVDKASLKKITGQTNGVLIVPKKELKDFPQQIKIFERSLRYAYEIAFVPPVLGAKDELREIDIEIVNPELRKSKLEIQKPKGYFIP